MFDFSDYWLSTKHVDLKTAVPVRRTHQFLEHRPDHRMMWRFYFEDKSVFTTFCASTAFALTERMMKAGLIKNG